MIIELPSVVSVIDSDTLLVYASYEAGGYDPDSVIHLSRCTATWHNNLDEWDQAAVQTILDAPNYFNKLLTYK